MAHAVLKRSLDQLGAIGSARDAQPARKATPRRRKEDAAAARHVSLVPSAVDASLRRQQHAAAVLREHGHAQLINDDHAGQIAALLRTFVLQTDDDVLSSAGGADRGMLVLLLRGEVRAELQRAPHEPMVWGVLGPGQWLGELPASMGGSASTEMAYYANSNIEVGVLPLPSLQDMMLNRPALAASLLLIVSHQLGVRLRDSQQRALLQHQWMSTVASAGRYDKGYRSLDIEFD